ncbi:MAG TPA: DnaA N-terminal domain-containing protein [Paenirhodobacter sp.]
MLIKKAVGRGGSTRKYDVLTVLAVHALAQDKGLQRQVLRLISLVTARYNWQGDLLSVGQEEIARLWSVDIRTVKREMAAFRARGWLVEKRAAVRGRVAQYGLGITRILDDTRGDWLRVGPDLDLRLRGDDGMPEAASTVIPFPSAAVPMGEGLWAQVSRRLMAEDPSIYRVWFAALEPMDEAGELLLRAPSGFHATYVQTHLIGRIAAVLGGVAPQMPLRIV